MQITIQQSHKKNYPTHNTKRTFYDTQKNMAKKYTKKKRTKIPFFLFYIFMTVKIK